MPGEIAGRPASARSGPVLLGAVLWLAAALVLGASGLLRALRPPLPQLVLVGLTLALIGAGIRVPSLRAWAGAVDLRVAVALSLTRFVGAYFLTLFRRGELPFAFAVPGGWGDMIVATLALVLLLSGPPRTPRRRLAYGVWNVIGLADILLVVATAARLALVRPGSMDALLRLPLSLLPTFLVPVIIASHVLIALRLRQPRRA